MKIGILAMQGAYREHISALKKLDTEPIEIRNKEEIENNDNIHIATMDIEGS